MAELVIVGELLVEIMRECEGAELYKEGLFRGPFPSGAPAICADTAARLGVEAVLIGAVGNDDFGRCLLDRLEADGVDISRVDVSNEVATGCTFVTYFADGSRKFIFHMGNSAASRVKAQDGGGLNGVEYMHIMGCSLMSDRGLAKEIIKTMRLLRERGTRLSFDPNIRKELFTDDSIAQTMEVIMKETSIFLPGDEELLWVTGEDTIEDAVKKCFQYPNMEIVVQKSGSKGSRIYTREGMTEIGVYPVKQVDATGAGDCFDGAFLAGLIKGVPIELAGKMGAAAGALNAAAFGPMEGRITKQTIEDMITGN